MTSTAPVAAPKIVKGIISATRRAETIDQFGTLHNGRAAYPGAAAALMRIRAAGREVVLLSNSGRPLH
ncbi:hypothetical protein [Bradyrhizobium sp.]|uniref:hypothetical protein n=1 Tax=Bradyrhizobium sp. TaxID=376 RepID=UPI003C766590